MKTETKDEEVEEEIRVWKNRKRNYKRIMV